MKKTITLSKMFDDKWMDKAFIKLILLLVFFFGIQNISAQTNTWDGSTSNSWGTSSNWSLNHVPTSSEDVVIPNVTTDPRYNSSSSTVKSITVQNGGNLVFERSTAYALIVTGNVTVNTGGTFAIRTGGTAVTNTLTIGGNFVNDGTVDFVDTCVINLNFNASSAQSVSGSGATMSLNALTLTNASTFAVNRSINLASNWTNNGKTVSGSGTVILSGTGTIGGSTSTAFPNLTVTGTISQGINTSVSGNYVQTGGTYNQNSGATAYSLTVTGNFSLSGSSVFNMQTTSNGAGATTTVNGATGTTISDTARLNMDDGGATASNVSIFQTTNFTTSATSIIIDFGDEGNTKNNEFRISGNCSKTGTTGRFYTSATPVNGGLVFNGTGATQTLSIVASSSTEYYNVTVNSSAVVQLTSALTLGTASNPASSLIVNGTLDAQAFSPAVLGGNSGTFSLASGATLITANTNGVVSGTNGTISTSVGTRTFNAAANYTFDGAANQTANFANTILNNLTIANTSGTVSLNAALTINNVTINSGGGSLTAGSVTHLVSGNWTNNGGTFVPGTGTISLNGTSQTIGGTSSSINFNNLSLSGGTKIFNKPAAIGGNLSIASGALANFGSLTTNTTGTLTLGGTGTGAAKFGSTSTSASAPVYKSNTYFTAVTTGYITVATSTCVAPTVTAATMASNNVIPSYAKNGDTITLNFTTSEVPNSPPTVLINGATTSVSGSGTSWTASIAANVLVDGLVTFSISFENSFGCVGTRNTLTSGSAVTVDKTSPVITIATIASNNSLNSSLVKSGDVITLTFVLSEAVISTPSVSLNGSSVTVTGSGTTWSATKTVVGGDINGLVTFSINVTDNAGNTGSSTTTTNSSSVTIDTAAPTIPITTIASNNVNSSSLAKAGDLITLIFTTSEILSSTPSVTILGGAATVSGSGTSWTATKTVTIGNPNGVASFSIGIIDAAGNIASGTATTDASSVIIDTLNPTITTATIASNNANSAVADSGDVITLSFITSETPSVAPIVTIDGTPATVSGSGSSWSATKTVASCSGTVVTFSITISDATGNTATGTTTTNGSQVTINPTPSATIVNNGGAICSGSNAVFTVNGSNGATLNYTITGQAGTQQLALTGSNQTISAVNATTDVTLTLISVVNATCNSSTFASGSSTVTVNPLPATPTISADGPTTFCSGGSVVLTSSLGSSYLWSNGATTQSITVTTSGNYTVQVTNSFTCQSASSAATVVTVTAQPVWYLDADNDGYYAGTSISSCTSPGTGYTTSVIGSGDCDDALAAINPGETDICYNGVDENCDTVLSDGCAPVVVNMTHHYDDDENPIASLSTAIPAVQYTYPGATNIKYRFSIKNITTNTTAPDIIQTSRYVTIPASIHLFNAKYTIKASAVINDEIVPFAGNTITILSPIVQLISLNTSSCGVTLASLTSTITSNQGLNATGYTFRIRLNDANPSPTYAYSQSATRFVSANSFTGFPLQYGKSYKISVQYTFTDPVTNLPVASGYGAECTVNTPSIPLTGLASPSCGSQVAAMNANISATSAPYATSYQFRIRLFTDNGPNPTYYYSVPNVSRFSSLTAFQGISLAYSTEYLISVQYSILNNSATEWSGYGAECKITTPFFPVTSLVPSQCGLLTPTALTQQLNITPYPGFPHYKVLLEEIDGEDVVNSEEREITYSYFKLSDFSIAQLGKNYNVSVAIKLNGVFGNYDTACDLFTEAPSKTAMLVPFKATAYPNPFSNNFALNVKTSSQSLVNLKVYDMVGRLIEQRDVKLSDMETTTIGTSYPSGVYNVQVTQQDSMETIRIIKR